MVKCVGGGGRTGCTHPPGVCQDPAPPPWPMSNKHDTDKIVQALAFRGTPFEHLRVFPLRSEAGSSYRKRELNLNLSGKEIYYMNDSILLVKNMLCSKLHCQKVLIELSSHMKSRAPLAGGARSMPMSPTRSRPTSSIGPPGGRQAQVGGKVVPPRPATASAGTRQVPPFSPRNPDQKVLAETKFQKIGESSGILVCHVTPQDPEP